MSDFLSNIVSRHSRSEQVIQPRSKSLFETHQPVSSSLHSSSEVEFSNPIPSSKISEERRETSKLDEVSNNQTLNHTIDQKNDPLISNEKRRTTAKKDDLLGKRMNLKKAEIKSENSQLKIQKIREGVLNESFDKLRDQKLDKEVSAPNLETTDSKKGTPIFSDRSLVQPNQVISKQLISNFNTNTQIEMNTRSNSVIEASSLNQAPTIKIHIGRIDIKAVKPSINTTNKVHKTNASAMSLDQVLKKRGGN